ncbi:hypothetical protein ACS0TY_017664 [Phlomoides rotata]
MASVSSSPRTVEEIFKDYSARRTGIIRALTYDVDEIYGMCDPEIKELLSIVLRDLHLSTTVVRQEGLAAVFWKCLINDMCSEYWCSSDTYVICIEDGVAIPTTQITLGYGGEVRIRMQLFNNKFYFKKV